MIGPIRILRFTYFEGAMPRVAVSLRSFSNLLTLRFDPPIPHLNGAASPSTQTKMLCFEMNFSRLQQIPAIEAAHPKTEDTPCEIFLG